MTMVLYRPIADPIDGAAYNPLIGAFNPIPPVITAGGSWADGTVGDLGSGTSTFVTFPTDGAGGTALAAARFGPVANALEDPDLFGIRFGVYLRLETYYPRTTGGLGDIDILVVDLDGNQLGPGLSVHHFADLSTPRSIFDAAADPEALISVFNDSEKIRTEGFWLVIGNVDTELDTATDAFRIFEAGVYIDTLDTAPTRLRRRPLRQFPRSDGLGMSSTRRQDANRSMQASLRRGGGVYF